MQGDRALQALVEWAGKKMKNWWETQQQITKPIGTAEFFDSKINRLFNVKMIWDRKHKCHRSFTNYQIPEYLKNVIQFVDGISNRAPPMKYTNPKIRPYSERDVQNQWVQDQWDNKFHNPIIPDKGVIGLEVLQYLYNIPQSLIDTNNVTIAAIEFQAPGFYQSDLTLYQRMNNLTARNISNDHIIDIHPYSVDVESSLDVQMISNANNSQMFYWNYFKGWMFGFSVEFINYTLTYPNDYPSIISISYGWAEADQCDAAVCINETVMQYVNRSDVEFMKIAVIGVSVLVSSGDAGAPGRTNEACQDINPIYPGSSPYVTSVGATFVGVDPYYDCADNYVFGTQLCKDYRCISGSSEYPTYYNYTGWTTGGGFELYSKERPVWQNSSVNEYLKRNAKRIPPFFNFNQYGRGYPDVSAVGHNCGTFIQGQLNYVDGTSCSSPVWASMIAMLNNYQIQRGKPVLGFLNPMLYFIYEKDSYAFNDITVGTNAGTESQDCIPSAGFVASKGWDPASGLGTPNIKRIVDVLDKYT